MFLMWNCNPKQELLPASKYEISSSEVRVEDNRLIFATKKSYGETMVNLVKLSHEAKANWTKSHNFISLLNAKVNNFTAPDVYKYVLNSDKQVRVEDMLIQIEGDTIISIPFSNKKLVSLLQVNPKAIELSSYKVCGYKPDPTNKNARYNGPLASQYFDAGSDIFNNGPFRYAVRLQNWVQPYSLGLISLVIYWEYRSPRNGSWYGEQAQLDYYFKRLRLQYQYSLPSNPSITKSGTVYPSDFQSGNNAGNGGAKVDYGLFGYTENDVDQIIPNVYFQSNWNMVGQYGSSLRERGNISRYGEIRFPTNPELGDPALVLRYGL